MSSDGSTRTAEATSARCLLCSVGCPVRAIASGPDHYVPDYMPHAGYVGLCGRGGVLVELLDHPARLLQARRGGEAVETAEAAAQIAEALRRGSSSAIIVDGNTDTDTLATVGRFAADVGARWSLYVPPSDAGLVHGLDTSGCTFVGPEELAEADAFLIIGDIYATHPVAAHWIFEAKAKQSRMPLLLIADPATATAKFATGLYQPALVVGETARAVAAVRTGQAEGLADGGALAGWKEQLQKAKRPAIVVGAEMGYADARALAAEVAVLAKSIGATVCPLTAYGGAWGALRTASANGGICPIEILSSPVDVLLVIGADLVSALGAKAASNVAAANESLYVGPMPNRLSDLASLVVPAAFPFETAGRALLGPDRPVEFEPLMAPPAGVPTVREILQMAGAPGDVRADVSAPCSGPEMPAAADEAGQGEGIRLALAADSIHFDDGSLTGRASWPQSVRGRPLLLMAQPDAEAAGLGDAQTAVIEGPGGTATVEVVVSQERRAGQARASAAFAEVRNVFGWTWDGARPGEPVCVTVRKA